MLKTWTSEMQRIGSNMIKTWAKEGKQLVLTCSKFGPTTKGEESALTCPKPELNEEERVTLTTSKLESQKKEGCFKMSDFKLSRFCF